MKVRFTARAGRDLAEIADRIAEDDPKRAEKFVGALIGRALSLERHPRRFPEAAGLGGGVRKLVWRDYLIFYRIAGEEVQVLRVVHGSRDWAALFVDGAQDQ